ncbi:MAG: hypothetical protein ACKPE6_17550 [Gammaproteobacteria bacterium]
MRAYQSVLKTPLGAAACLLLCTTLGVTAPALAKPVKITFTSDITSSTLAGVGADDTLIIDFIVDNGSSGILGQSWDLDDILSATVRAGSFTQSYTGGWWTEDPDEYAPAGWSTDGSGQLVFNQFYGVWDPYELCEANDVTYENCTPGYAHILAADSIHELDSPDNIAYFEQGWSGYEGKYPQGQWSISEVPLPGTLPLLGAGLLGLGLLRRRG